MSKQYCLVQLGRKASKEKQVASLNNYYLVSVTKKTRVSKKDNPKKIQLISWAISEYQGGKLVKHDQNYSRMYRGFSLELTAKAILQALGEIPGNTNKPVIIETHAIGIFKKLAGLKVSKRQEHELDKIEPLLTKIAYKVKNYAVDTYLIDIRYQSDWTIQGIVLNNYTSNKAKMIYQTTVKKKKRKMVNPTLHSGRPHIVKKGIVKPKAVSSVKINARVSPLPTLNFVPAKGNRVYIDGAKRHSSGVGAYGYFAQLEGQAKPISYAKADKGNLTSQRMELRGLLSFLKKYQSEWSDKHFAILTDSQYVFNILTKSEYLENWVVNDFKRVDNKPLKNADLLKSIARYLKGSPKLFMVKVKGHSDVIGNNQIDKLLNQAMDNF